MHDTDKVFKPSLCRWEFAKVNLFFAKAAVGITTERNYNYVVVFLKAGKSGATHLRGARRLNSKTALLCQAPPTFLT